MAGEVGHRPVRAKTQPVAAEAMAAVQAADSPSGETIAVRAPRWLWPTLIALLAGGGIGSGVVGLAHGVNPTPGQVEVPALTRAEVQTEAQKVAKEASEQARADCRRELAAAQSTTNQTLTRIDVKIDKLSDELSDLRADVAALEARRK